jgi:phage tail protein X
MDKINAFDGERLDQITYRFYGDIDMFEEVVDNNPNLLDRIFLNSNDVVNMPGRIEKPNIKEVINLWD